MVELQPIAPSEALDFYLAQREDELAFEIHRSHWYRLESFIEWCEGTEIDNMNSLTARHIHKFRLYRKKEQNIGKVTVRTQFSTIRVFVKFLESIDGVEQGLHEKILIPSIDGREGARDRLLSSE
jgi:site-specific recombinase XerD